MTVKEVIDDVYSDDNDITLSGGDPLTYQIDNTVYLVKELKRTRPNVNIWCYTGYFWEDMIKIPKVQEALRYIDVIVDGKFENAYRDKDLPFRGSSNQRIINVKDSLRNKEVVLWNY